MRWRPQEISQLEATSIRLRRSRRKGSGDRSKTTGAWEHASWDESAAGQNEDDYQDENFADEDEEGAVTLAAPVVQVKSPPTLRSSNTDVGVPRNSQQQLLLSHHLTTVIIISPDCTMRPPLHNAARFPSNKSLSVSLYIMSSWRSPMHRVQTCTSRGVLCLCLVTPGERIFLVVSSFEQDGEI